MILSQKIKSICLREGFAKVGFAKSAELEKEGKFLKHWLREGKNASMEWMNRSFEKRVNPSLLMDEVKSVISLAYIYDTPFEHSTGKNIPKISRYAWGRVDYHEFLKNKLKIICKEIESSEDGIRTRFYVDDGPVMDKAWAVRSGIGWQGKNTNVINVDFGSFFFIATILINRELEYDASVEDLCKSCSLCITSCPTGALGEYEIDSALCISYQTIENRGDIPEDIDLNGWIFGCDICQDVCPFNNNPYFTNESKFFPDKELFEKEYEELNMMNESEFRNKFSGTPVMRTKYKGWVRNLNHARSGIEK